MQQGAVQIHAHLVPHGRGNGVTPNGQTIESGRRTRTGLLRFCWEKNFGSTWWGQLHSSLISYGTMGIG